MDNIENKITVTLNNTSYDLFLEEERMQIDESNHNMLRIFHSRDFFGKAVTIGYQVVDLGKDEVGAPTVRITVKASICADSDTYDERHGIETVAGRLLLAQEDESLCTISASGKHMRNMADSLVQSKAESLAKFILERDKMISSLKRDQNEIRSYLKDRFQEFK